MKRFFLAAAVVAVIFAGPVFAEGDLAVFSVEQRIAGMQVENQTPGYGDRFIRFEYQIEADDMEAATEAWFANLRVLIGEDQLEKFQAFTRAAETGRR